MYAIDPELIFLKWAYKRELIDADDLHAIHTRGEKPDSYLELLVEEELLTRDQIDALLVPAEIDADLARGLIDERNAAALRQLLDD